MNNVKNNLRREFTTIPNALINDQGLSRDARFLFVYMASKPDDWQFWNKDLCTALGDNEKPITPKTMLVYMNELITAGWVTRQQVRGESGRYETYDYTLLSTPTASPEGKIYRTVKITPIQILTTNIEGEEKTKKSAKKDILSDPETITALKEKFPDVDVDREIEKMLNWLESTGSRKKNYIAFARNWLMKTQESGGKKTNTDKALNDADLSGNQQELYSVYIAFVIENYPTLFKSETRVLSKSEYKAYLENTNTPTLPTYITPREKSELMAKTHQVLDRDKFARDRNRTVFEAYLKQVQSAIHKTPVRL